MNSVVKLLRVFIVLLALFLFNYEVEAKGESELFSQANQLYMDQSYEKAAAAYEQLLQAGKTAPEIYFNLGNAYYKTGNIAAAILNYERAKRLRPSDPDIAYNLRMANLNTIDKIEPLPQLFYEKWWDDYVNEGSVNRRAMIAVALFWITFGVGVVYLFSRRIAVRKITFFLMLLLALAGTFTWYLTYQQNRHLNNHQAAIIFTDSAYAKSSPDDKSANLFLLHAGTRIEVLDELKGWKKVRIANGNEGWITSDAIVII